MSEKKIQISNSSNFMKNTDCEHRGSKCAIFGGNCSCTSKEECGMEDKDIKELSAADFLRVHSAIPMQYSTFLVAKDWYRIQYMDSLKKVGWGDANEKEQNS